jgi:hypothetical protein
MRQQWKDSSGYEQFFDATTNPRAVAPSRDMGPLADRFEQIKKESPTFLKPTPAGLQETQFKSVGRTRAASLMDEVISNRNGMMSLEKLKQLRTDVDELIDVGQATPDSGTRYLKMIRTAITKEMDATVDSWGDKAAKTQWKKINQEYAANTERFQQAGIAELFAEKSQGGRFVPDS